MATISGEVRDENDDLLADCVVRAYQRDTGALLVAGLSGDGSEEIPADANYASVALLLHCDGTDGGTTFTDSSGTPKTVTAHSQAHIETDQSKYGGASAAFDGASDYLAVSHAGLNLGSGDFTVEGWLRVNNLDNPVGVWFVGTPTLNSNRIQSDILTTGELGFYGAAAAVVFNARGTAVLAINTWYHVAFVRSGTNAKIYVDGSLYASATITGEPAAGQNWRIGFARTSSTDRWLNGYWDEVRITPGVARYAADFTPPAHAFAEGSAIPARPLGEYVLTTAYTGEVNVIALDPDGGTTFNDLILRTTPI